MDKDITANLAENLRLLCTFHASIAEICRQMKINRQQFNKYLSGESQPSLRNLRRITDFFGVDEYEIMLPHDAFVPLVMPRRIAARNEADMGDLLAQLVSRLFASASSSHAALKPYCGHFAVYFCTPVWSSHVVRALTSIYQDDKNTYTKSLERLNVGDERRSSKVLQKFEGVALCVLDRIYILEYEAASRDLIALTVLYPSHRKQMRYLTGILLTIASGGNRQPFASRVVYEYLGRDVDLRREIARSRLYPLDSPEIAEEIRSRIGNNADPSQEVLLPRSY